MPDVDTSALNAIRSVRQTRQFTDEPVDQHALDQILDIARWSGSAMNTQPWHFIVTRDRDRIQQISEVRDAINWVRTAPVLIAITLDGSSKVPETYDEGRVTERIMIAAKLLGLSAAVGWYGDRDQQAAAKAILGIPEERTARSVVTIGHPDISGSKPSGGGRKPLEEIVSYERFGQRA